ncbi:Alpha/Beta hydrolase protein [Neurospora intermedia]|uniref:Alpha/Beta hydrolase protein n=1 Tax=Neurospora intermedia TaxID=5142 RepID=A0ABR3D957_NEUIN
MADNKFDPEYFQIIQPVVALKASLPPPAPITDIDTLRTNSAGFELVLASIPDSPDITETTYQIPSKDGTLITLYRFTPAAAAAATPGPRAAVLYHHGGGFVQNTVVQFRKEIKRYAHGSGLTFYAAEYRVAPEHPFPTPFDDCYSALEWLHANAASEQIDPARIALLGVSAGAGLAAAVALKARDDNVSPPIKKLVLAYPMLDDRTYLPEDHPLSPYLMWNGAANRIAWGAYAGADGVKEISPYAAPARAKDLSGMPPTYIDCGELDLFRDEDVEFAARLLKAGVRVELHLYPGVPHAFEMVAVNIRVSKKAVENRLRALENL